MADARSDLLRELLEFIDKQKSFTEIFIPTWAEPLFDDLRVQSTWVAELPMFEHPFNSIRIRGFARDKYTLEIEFDHPDGTRLGMVWIRRPRPHDESVSDDAAS